MSEAKQDLPGGLALQQAVERGEWPHTLDASVWADEFTKHFSGHKQPDRYDMIVWFANAIMAGYDTAMARARKSK